MIALNRVGFHTRIYAYMYIFRFRMLKTLFPAQLYFTPFLRRTFILCTVGSNLKMAISTGQLIYCFWWSPCLRFGPVPRQWRSFSQKFKIMDLYVVQIDTWWYFILSISFVIWLNTCNLFWWEGGSGDLRFWGINGSVGLHQEYKRSWVDKLIDLSRSIRHVSHFWILLI